MDPHKEPKYLVMCEIAAQLTRIADVLETIDDEGLTVWEGQSFEEN